MTEDFPFDEDAVPEPDPAVDIEGLSNPPSADDFFLFERIDGSKSVAELCSVSGLGREETLDSLVRLCESGLIELPGYEPDEAAGEGTEAEGPSDETDAGDDGGESSSSGIDLSHLPTPPEEYDYDESLLEADLPLDETMRRELMCLAGQLDSLDHYQFFGVDRDASRKEIKMSYFQLSKRYHPDKHFGDEIGPFEEMLEEIFQTITRAYRTLSDEEKRREYDRDLDDLEEAGEAEVDDETPTPMNRPSSVRMAEEGAGEAEFEPTPESGRRDAAFVQLVREAEEFRKEGEILDAVDAYRKALAFRRELEVALEASKLLLRIDEQPDQAELFARAGLKIESESIEAHMLLGKALERQGRDDEARGVYESVLELEPTHEQAKTRRDRLARN